MHCHIVLFFLGLKGEILGGFILLLLAVFAAKVNVAVGKHPSQMFNPKVFVNKYFVSNANPIREPVTLWCFSHFSREYSGP